MSDLDGEVWSRKVAHHKIYLENRENYPLSFEHYEVHHINGDKNNNTVENLAVLTQEEHLDIHQIIKENNDYSVNKERLYMYAYDQFLFFKKNI